MSTSFMFRKTLLEPLGSSVYEFPYSFAEHAWPRILEDRTDPYETVSMQIGSASANKKAHVMRVVDLFEQTLKHVGTANIRADTIISVHVHKTSGITPNQQPMKLLTQPRTFEFHTHVATVEVSKILLSHDPTRLDVVVRIDKRHQRGPVPLRNLRQAYKATLLDFIESERQRLNASDAVRSTELRSAPVTVHVIKKGTAAPSPPPQHQQQQQQQVVQQRPSPVQYSQQPLSQPPPGGESGSPVPLPPGSSSGNIYPVTSPTSSMYAPQQQQQKQFSQGVQVRTPQEEAAREARRKDQPPAPLLEPGMSQTSMYFEMGQYGPATTGGNGTALPPDFFASA